MTEDERYMRRCIELARNGEQNAKPNPMVGAVVVHNGRIIGEGYHVRCGEGHAEVNAIASVKAEDIHLLNQSTIYVSLEPCAHYGKTPPCADLIVEKGLKRAVVGCRDPFAKVQGRGIKKLEEAGIEVTVGVLEHECLELNKHFMTYHGKQRPFVTLKWAQTADGIIGREHTKVVTDNNHERLIISNKLTTMICHKRRTEHSAIMVGHTTALTDNPSLTAREWVGPNPTRIVLARHNDFPHTSPLLSNAAKTLIITDKQHIKEYTNLQESNETVEVTGIDFNGNVIRQVMNELHKRGIQSVLVEGGRTLLQSFIDSGYWDEAYVETSIVNAGQGVKSPVLKNAECVANKCYLSSRIAEYRRK